MRLAIFTSQLGTASETFIQRHVEDLLPGRTVVVARNSTPAFGGFWEASCPVLFLDCWMRRLSVRLVQRAGVPETHLRDAAVARLLRRSGVNVVLGEYLDQFIDFVPLFDRMRIPYVVQGHGIDLSAALRQPAEAERYLAYRSARAVLARCEFHRQRLIQIGLPPDKIHVNPGGVDVPSDLPLRGPDACKRFLAVGRMVPKKGPIYMLDAFRVAAAQDPEITLDYIGGGQLFAAAKQFVDVCGLQERVQLHGPAPEETKNRLFGKCGVFVQHSITDPETGDEEGLPAAIQEAMAQGMAVISTRHAGIPEAVEHGVTGLLVGERDVSGMGKAMSCIARDIAVCARLGLAAHLKAKQFYSWPAERARLLTALGCLFETARSHA
jgi:colanic acid/amylovoran biosynthesis glycosyltransferase